MDLRRRIEILSEQIGETSAEPALPLMCFTTRDGGQSFTNDASGAVYTKPELDDLLGERNPRPGGIRAVIIELTG